MKKLMLGNEAIARGAFEAGISLISSYPGTPSTEITECAAKYTTIISEWAPNEKVALETAAGASFGGARALTAMKHVGLNVAADPLFTLSYTGVNAALVVCVADDPGMHSSQNEQDSRNYALASKVPMLEPSDSAECLDFVKEACRLSEGYDTPVMLRLSTRVSHSQSLVEVSDPEIVELKDYEQNPMKYVMMPGMARRRHILVEERMKKLAELSETSPLNRIEKGNGKIGVITAGIAYQYAKEALGESASYLKLGMIYPLPEKLIRDFVSSVETCYVIEELDPFIETHCRALGLNVTGKAVLSLLGEYSPNQIKAAVLGDNIEESFTITEVLPDRPPVMCAGCPHRAVFHVLKEMKLNVSGDIGCYTLGAMKPLNAIHSCVCMGASIGVAHGMEKARGRDFAAKTVAVIGDSTFIHSGITGLINMVYNGGTGTVIILDNSITGMTGHQQNPTTGYTLKGDPATVVSLEKLCDAVGVKRVTVVDPFDGERLRAALKEDLSAPEPSVIIARRPCALLPSFKSGEKASLIKENCKNCGVCLKIGCPAIMKKDGVIDFDQSLCNGCGYCQRLCKFSAIAGRIDESEGDSNGL